MQNLDKHTITTYEQKILSHENSLETQIILQQLQINHEKQIECILKENNLPFVQSHFHTIVNHCRKSNNNNIKQNVNYLVASDLQGNVLAFVDYFLEEKFSRGGVIQMHIQPIVFSKLNILNMIEKLKAESKNEELVSIQQIHEVLTKNILSHIINSDKQSSYKITYQTDLQDANILTSLGFKVYQELHKNDAFMTRNRPEGHLMEFKSHL